MPVKAIVAGWGRKEGGLPESQRPVLREVDVPLITWETCSKQYGFVKEKGMNSSFVIANTMLCAGYPEGQKDSCQGDSGGPLMLHNPDRDTYTQVGIVSWGNGCAQPGQPGVYTKLSKYVNWVHSHVQTCRNREVR